MLDRTEYIEEIADEFKITAAHDLRIGQVFEILRSRVKDDLWNLENEKLLELLKLFNSEYQ